MYVLLYTVHYAIYIYINTTIIDRYAIYIAMNVKISNNEI